ncbi:MAG: cation transporter [Melioribacteraceae bacterium]|jgi:copper chaperone|nr:cation transporter [Melioribacteraceae bacterium]
MNEQLFVIDGMSCNHCKMAVEAELKDAGFKNFTVEVGSAKVECNTNEDKLKTAKAIESAGYKITN